VDAAVREWEPPSALFAGPDGLDAVRELAQGALEWLQPGGWLVLEIGTAQGPVVADLLSAAGLVQIEVRADLAGHDRIAIARAG
jgi:release factor glutamine methyltransferase